MRAIYFIGLLFVILGIFGWYQMTATTIIEQIYGISVLLAATVIPYVIVKLIEGVRK